MSSRSNKLIGRTGLDVDMKRAADELGLVGHEDIHQLRTMKPGEFFGFGPALPVGVNRIRVGPIVTTHPKAGSRIEFSPPPPTSKIKALLPKLADLPAEAEERQKSIDGLKRKLANTRRELTEARKGVPTVLAKERIVEKPVEVPVLYVQGETDAMWRSV